MRPGTRPLTPSRLVAAAVLLCLPAFKTALAAGCERRPVAQVPLQDDAGFLSIPASIGGHPVRLMIDTGSDAGLITPDAAGRLDLAIEPGARIRVQGSEGAGHGAEIARISDLAIGALRIGAWLMPLGALPGAPSLTPPVVGFLGGDLLSRFDLDVDVPGGRLTFYDVSLPSLACAAPPAWTGGFATVSLAAHGVRLSLTASLDGRPIEALLDTGARSRIVSTAAALRRGVGAQRLASEAGGITSGVDLREQSYHWHRFASFSVAGQTTRSPVLTVAPVPGPFGMLLGSDWFARREVWISYATGQMFIRKDAAP